MYQGHVWLNVIDELVSKLKLLCNYCLQYAQDNQIHCVQ